MSDGRREMSVLREVLCRLPVNEAAERIEAKRAEQAKRTDAVRTAKATMSGIRST